MRTRLGRDGSLLLHLGLMLARPFLLSPQRGTGTIIYLATSPQVAGATGGCYVKRQRREPSAAAHDKAAARRLWQLSEELTGLKAREPVEDRH